MRADFKNTKVGDQIVFKKAGEWHYFKDRIENAKKLEEGKIYTVKEISVASSSTGVKLEETGELEYELCWFGEL
jgi:MoaA/NifB/PqqE/SkfB family radical SAM enzyme